MGGPLGDGSLGGNPNTGGSLSTAGVGAGWMTTKYGNINFSALVSTIDQLSVATTSKIAQIRSKGSAMSIADMFDLQMAMNKLSQFSEMSTAVISALTSSSNSVSRNIKS